MQISGWRNEQVQKHASLRGSGSCVWFPLLVSLVCVPAAWPQTQPVLPTLSADQVVQRLIEKNRERANSLQHYIGKRSYRLEYRGFPASADATMEVELN